MTGRPEADEAAPYYFGYIDQVPNTSILEVLAEQLKESLALFATISAQQSLHRYGPDTWSIRQVLNHINDCERLFQFRAFWFARGFESELPSFDQEVAARAAEADVVSWAAHVGEFERARLSTLAFFENLPNDAWLRRGVASGNPFTVRALAYLAAGHVAHHTEILGRRYLQS